MASHGTMSKLFDYPQISFSRLIGVVVAKDPSEQLKCLLSCILEVLQELIPEGLLEIYRISTETWSWTWALIKLSCFTALGLVYLRVKARHAGDTKDLNSRVSNKPGLLIFKRVDQFDIELWINLLK